MLQERILQDSRIGVDFIPRVAAIHSQNASRIAWHSHEHIELILLADGATGYEFRCGKRIQLNGGQFALIPSGVEHRGIENVRSPTRFTGIMVAKSLLASTVHPLFADDDLKRLQETFGQVEVGKMGMSPLLRMHVRALPSLIQGVLVAEPFSLTMLRLQLCQILLEVSKLLADLSQTTPKAVVESAAEFMKNNVAEYLSIDDVASHVNCCRAKLFKTFKDTTGMSPNDYWQRIRIEKAQLKLKSSKLSITQIAIDCGFGSSQYFSSVFRKYTGITPRQYRDSVIQDYE